MNGAAAEALQSHIRSLCPVGPVGVAVSGGSDSMALLTLAAAACDVRAATVDHGLRPDAAYEAKTVAAFCAERGIPHQTLALKDLHTGGNLAARARDMRYAVLAEWSGREGIPAVLLGHTRDDQAETVLMRLARGSAVDGLSGMAEQRRWHGVEWIRPLLTTSRQDLRAWLLAKDIAWSDDPSNDDDGYDRVKARKALQILAPLGISAEGIASTATRLQDQRRVLEEACETLWASVATERPFGEICLGRAAMADALPDTAARVLSKALQRVSGAGYRPRQRALERLITVLAEDGDGAQTVAGCLVLVKSDRVTIAREPSAMKPAKLTEGVQTWEGWEIRVTASSRPLWVASLRSDGWAELRRRLRSANEQTPPEWEARFAALGERTPGIFRTPDPGAASLLSVPLAGGPAGETSERITMRYVGGASTRGA